MMVAGNQNAYDWSTDASNVQHGHGSSANRDSKLASPFFQFTWVLEKRREQMKLMRRVGRVLRNKWLWGITLVVAAACVAFAALYSPSDGIVRFRNEQFPRYPANVADREVTAEYFLSLVEDPNVTTLAYETFKKTASGKEIRWPVRLEDLTSRNGDGAAGKGCAD